MALIVHFFACQASGSETLALMHRVQIFDQHFLTSMNDTGCKIRELASGKMVKNFDAARIPTEPPSHRTASGWPFPVMMRSEKTTKER